MDRLCGPLPSREAAYLAYLFSLKDKMYIGEALNTWASKSHPEPRTLALAYEIAQGACRMSLALDHIALGLSEKKSLSLKLKEKALLRTTLYQLYYLRHSQKHAIGDESVKLAKKYTSSFFAKFLNAIIRKSEGIKKEDLLPTGTDAQSLSIQNSFPLHFVQKILPLKNAVQILETLNKPPQVMARIIGTGDFTLINNKDELIKATTSDTLYIQNQTSIKLMDHLFDENFQPKSLLDLCASPGGKLIRAHELFPDARLFANDVSEPKITRLQDNLRRFHINADSSIGKGETFSSNDRFDLIILDVPCSNSGVFHKKAEARWRLSPESIKDLNQIQTALIKNALTLLTPNGRIWYMTCSILPDENGVFLESIQDKLQFKTFHPLTLYPENDQDGGFCALIKQDV